MVSAGQVTLRSRAVGGRHDQFVGPEVAVARTTDRHPEHIEDSHVEDTAGVKVTHHQLKVVDEAASVQFLRFHALLHWMST